MSLNSVKDILKINWDLAPEGIWNEALRNCFYYVYSNNINNTKKAFRNSKVI